MGAFMWNLPALGRRRTQVRQALDPSTCMGGPIDMAAGTWPTIPISARCHADHEGGNPAQPPRRLGRQKTMGSAPRRARCEPDRERLPARTIGWRTAGGAMAPSRTARPIGRRRRQLNVRRNRDMPGAGH